MGPDGDPTALADVSEHVHLEKFVDQSRVLPLVDAVVHHGGTGSVLGALATGLPQLILPQGADQFFNARFLTEAGAARALRNEEHGPGEIRRAVSELLSGGAEQKVARQIQAEINPVGVGQLDLGVVPRRPEDANIGNDSRSRPDDRDALVGSELALLIKIFELR